MTNAEIVHLSRFLIHLKIEFKHFEFVKDLKNHNIESQYHDSNSQHHIISVSSYYGYEVIKEGEVFTEKATIQKYPFDSEKNFPEIIINYDFNNMETLIRVLQIEIKK